MLNIYFILIFNLNIVSKSIYQTVINSQAWVAFCTTLLVMFIQEMHEVHNSNLIWLVFFSTLFAYNLAYWVISYPRNYRLLVMAISIVISFCIFLRLNEWTSQLLILIGGCISVLYSLPIYRLYPKSLRQIPHLKILLIAWVWSIAVNVSIIEVKPGNVNEFIWSFFAIFCFVLGITIPFDIRDFHTDKLSLKTIPQQYGVKKSKVFACILLLLSAFLLQKSIGGYWNAPFIGFSMTIILAIVFIYFQKSTSSVWYTAFWIEGLSALPFFIFKILSYIIS